MNASIRGQRRNFISHSGFSAVTKPISQSAVAACDEMKPMLSSMNHVDVWGWMRR
jgi:hypothetical protein